MAAALQEVSGSVAAAKKIARHEKAPPVVLREVVINNGHDRGVEVDESGPDGRGREVHVRVKTGRMIDALFHAGKIGGRQHQAATMLRDLYEKAGVSMGREGARDFHPASKASGVDPWEPADEASWHKYNNALQVLARDRRRIVRDVAISDLDPIIWGQRMRCHGITAFKDGLDQLVKYWGL